ELFTTTLAGAAAAPVITGTATAGRSARRTRLVILRRFLIRRRFMQRWFLLFLPLLAALSLGILVAKGPAWQQQALLQQDGVQIFARGLAVSDTQFIDQYGQPVSVAQLRGRHLLLFFGYTFCPDICPTTLMDLNRLWKQLPEAVRADWQVIMVSVDPQRDTPESMAPYLRYFNPSFMAFTGNEAGVKVLAAELNAIYSKVERGPDQPYLMDHSANLVIVDRHGSYRGYIAPPHDAGRMLPLLQAV